MAQSICRPSSRCSCKPMDDASMAQPRAPLRAKRCSAACRVTGSGVVRPVLSRPLASDGAPLPNRPQPRVPIKPAQAGVGSSAARACANHQALEVLPLVPVTANTGMRVVPPSKNAATSAPSCSCKPFKLATGAPAKSQACAPCASTRQAVAPRCTACATWRRASLAAPGQATKPSPGRTRRLSLTSVPVTRVCNQARASARWARCCIKSSRLRLRPRPGGVLKYRAAHP